MPSTADCCSFSSQMRRSVVTSTHMPSQAEHSHKRLLPTCTAFISEWSHFGQSRAAPVASVRWATAPQCEQNFSPINIMPNHDGQATVARRVSQKAHFDESLETAAPQFGQCKV